MNIKQTIACSWAVLYTFVVSPMHICCFVVSPMHVCFVVSPMHVCCFVISPMHVCCFVVSPMHVCCFDIIWCIESYLTFCMFSFEFKESSLSDTLQDVASPHCDDKRKAWHCTRSSLPNYFVISLECGIKYVNVSNVNKAIECT